MNGKLGKHASKDIPVMFAFCFSTDPSAQTRSATLRPGRVLPGDLCRGLQFAGGDLGGASAGGAVHCSSEGLACATQIEILPPAVNSSPQSGRCSVRNLRRCAGYWLDKCSNADSW